MPVITIDGPAASGKGVIAGMLAQEMRWNLLDSGVFYRAVAYVAQERGVERGQVDLIELARNPPFFLCRPAPWLPPSVFFEGRDITRFVRTEEIADIASKIATIGEVRGALMLRMLAEKNTPGLIADGRDMGTVVFPDATIKIFTVSQLEVRAKRRFEQAMEDKGEGSLLGIMQTIQMRDRRDEMRAIAPLKPAKNAIIIDSSQMTVVETFCHVVSGLIGRNEAPLHSVTK
ncbi:cytidylate kinase [Gammaproteobacteria bacterium 42_54_T18]|nr:cytidylate kinase [Gammaproteobacteria bacterium 42_54_T18]